ETLPPTACSLMTSPYLSLPHGQGAYLPRSRALALFGRRLPERVARSSLPASENLHKNRRPADGSYVCCFRRNRTHAPQQSEATRLRLHVSPQWSARVYRPVGG